MVGNTRLWIGRLTFSFAALRCVESYGVVDISLSMPTVPPGGIAVVSLDLNDASDLPAVLVVELHFDTALLTICGINAEAASGDASLEYAATEDGMVLVLFGGTVPISEGVLATVFLELNPNALLGTTMALSNGNSSASNAAADLLDLTLASSTLTVTALAQPHDADTDSNGRINLSEVLRVVQLYTLGDYYCDASTEDGFSPTAGHRDCTPHDLDYGEQDWHLSLSELLRCIQFFNAFKGRYHVDTEGEDGFVPGLDRVE